MYHLYACCLGQKMMVHIWGVFTLSASIWDISGNDEVFGFCYSSPTTRDIKAALLNVSLGVVHYKNVWLISLDSLILVLQVGNNPCFNVGSHCIKVPTNFMLDSRIV
jgi:hypothetical protein